MDGTRKRKNTSKETETGEKITRQDNAMKRQRESEMVLLGSYEQICPLGCTSEKDEEGNERKDGGERTERARETWTKRNRRNEFISVNATS